jgi:hypothetical protein
MATSYDKTARNLSSIAPLESWLIVVVDVVDRLNYELFGDLVDMLIRSRKGLLPHNLYQDIHRAKPLPNYFVS